MRLAFGLIGLLGGLIAIVLFMSFAYLPYTQQVVSKGQSAQSQAEQMAGIDSTLGGRVSQHLTLEPIERGGRVSGLTVKSISPGSSYQSYYGIQTGDIIEEIGGQKVRDLDAETAKALALESYQRKWDLGITRGGKRFMLPADMNAAAAATGTRTLAPNVTPTAQQTGIAQPGTAQPAAAQPGQQPGQPAKQNADPNMTPLQRQMDAILNFNNEDAGK